MLVERKVNGQAIVLDTEKMDQTWLDHCLAYGIGRFINDKYSGEKGQTKYDLCMLLGKEMQNGEPMPAVVRGGGGGQRQDPVKALAFKNAKADLSALFRNVTGFAKGIDQAGHEKVAPFFVVKDDRATWNDTNVEAWMTKQKEAGKTDYMKAAKDILTTDVDKVAIDLDF
jgi:hypothetical protein